MDHDHTIAVTVGLPVTVVWNLDTRQWTVDVDLAEFGESLADVDPEYLEHGPTAGDIALMAANWAGWEGWTKTARCDIRFTQPH